MKGGSETRQAFVLAGVVALIAGGIGGAGIYTSVSARNQEQNQTPATTPAGPLCRAADRAELVPAGGALFGASKA
jgi:hypothetical protein